MKYKNISIIFKNINTLRSRYRLLLITLILVLVSFTTLQVSYMNDICTRWIKNRMIAASEIIQKLDLDDNTFYKDIVECEIANNIYIEIYSSDDDLIYTTGENFWIYNPDFTSSDQNLKPRIMKTLSHNHYDENSCFELRQENYVNAKYLVYKIQTDNNRFDIYYSIDTIASNAKSVSIILFILSFSLVVLILLSVVAYYYTFASPLQKINKVTKRIANMDFSQSVPPFKIRELGELSTNVNTLSSALDVALCDLKSKNTLLEHEIDRERQLDETRKQFIANASHELKTPVSIILGYTEGLKYGITDGSPEEYCDAIIEETEKMNVLIKRLIEVAKYDNSSFSLHISNFNIKNFLESFLSSRIILLKNEGISVAMNIDPSFFGRGDKELLSEVFANYFSNAVSHCDFERKITIICTPLDDCYRLSVINTGKPISEDDLENIWESFYRADKAHSRSEQRYGLGLSIVASLQKKHGQKYGVLNHSRSVEFWFDIEKAELQQMNNETAL